MRPGVAVLASLLLCGLNPALAQGRPNWWVSFDLGAGQIKMSTDQTRGKGVTTFAMGFAGGRKVTDWARVGLHLNGWLLQAFNLNDPTVGESVSNVNGIVDVFPIRNRTLFLRAGGGLSMYTNERLEGGFGNGPGWEIGGGYEYRIRGNLSLAPEAGYSAGGLGNGYVSPPAATGLHFSVLEFKLAANYRFRGRAK